ncbi:MAG: DUF814 domain-containing protein [Campylobacterales bacterium]|nr:DUF814 domain-containing protein [Campylobacterales bacterium]
MKHYILKQIVAYLDNFKLIKTIKRVDNNTLKIEFENKEIIYLDMTKANAHVYKKEQHDNIKKDFNAPFDVILNKRFTNSKIKKVCLYNDDKIIHFIIENKSAYKIETLFLFFEFTGIYSNVIITDENKVILEALRHVDERSSSRVIKVGQVLQDVPKPDFVFDTNTVEDINRYLYDVYTKKQEQHLNSIKIQKSNQIKKQLKKLKQVLENLEDINFLQNQASMLNEQASNILIDIHNFQGYEKEIRLKQSNDLFRHSKKAKQKAKNQHIEMINIESKISYFEKLNNLILNAQNLDEIEFYYPKKEKNQTKTKKANPYQSFFIDGYKILLGRDERENIYLLENSKASDFWFHLQGQVSSHVIVKNKKKELPQHIIDQAASICAKFSVASGGVYSVDFTQRRNVKIQTGANVLYNPYSTVVVKI